MLTLINFLISPSAQIRNLKEINSRRLFVDHEILVNSIYLCICMYIFIYIFIFIFIYIYISRGFYYLFMSFVEKETILSYSVKLSYHYCLNNNIAHVTVNNFFLYLILTFHNFISQLMPTTQ